uniref:Uncharacterized protein n=1 Tax=Salix viminalis TaxID=40686 RepID=A0A6N2KBX9_SALVM
MEISKVRAVTCFYKSPPSPFLPLISSHPPLPPPLSLPYLYISLPPPPPPPQPPPQRRCRRQTHFFCAPPTNPKLDRYNLRKEIEKKREDIINGKQPIKL